MYDNVRPRRFGAGNPTRMHCPDCNKLIPAPDFLWHREQVHPPSTIEINPGGIRSEESVYGSPPPKE